MFRLGLGLMAVAIAGCIPYAYPSITATPPVNAGAADDEIHVFRVDVSSKSSTPALYGDESYALSEIELRAGRVPPQVQAGMDTGVIIIGVALNYHFHYHNGIEVRLYRPGCNLIRIQSWQAGKSPDWQAVRNFTERENAIDELVAPGGKGDASAHVRPASARLRDGSYSEAHRKALLFAAEEFRRLAESNDPECTAEARQRLLSKAIRLQSLSETSKGVAP